MQDLISLTVAIDDRSGHNINMPIKRDTKNDPSRIAVAVFIVATTLTISVTHFTVPSFLFIPLGMFMLGLIVSAVLAFLFILAKGYELRYGKKEDNLIDRFNYILYNSAMTAYVIVMGVILLGFVYKYLDEASKAGNVWASIGIGLLFIGIVALINRKDIKELSVAAYTAFNTRYRKIK